jgi:hypothetical protein
MSISIGLDPQDPSSSSSIGVLHPNYIDPPLPYYFNGQSLLMHRVWNMSIENASKLTIIHRLCYFNGTLIHQDPSSSSCQLRFDTSKLTVILRHVNFQGLIQDPSSISSVEAWHIQIDNNPPPMLFQWGLIPPRSMLVHVNWRRHPNWQSSAHVISMRLNHQDPSSSCRVVWHRSQ